MPWGDSLVQTIPAALQHKEQTMALTSEPEGIWEPVKDLNRDAAFLMGPYVLFHTALFQSQSRSDNKIIIIIKKNRIQNNFLCNSLEKKRGVGEEKGREREK